MFSRKNKQASPPDSQGPALSSQGQPTAFAGQSLFAPAINPRPSQIDFGLHGEVQPPQPASPAPSPPPEPDYIPEPQPLQWEAPAQSDTSRLDADFSDPTPTITEPDTSWVPPAQTPTAPLSPDELAEQWAAQQAALSSDASYEEKLQAVWASSATTSPETSDFTQDFSQGVVTEPAWQESESIPTPSPLPTPRFEEPLAEAPLPEWTSPEAPAAWEEPSPSPSVLPPPTPSGLDDFTPPAPGFPENIGGFPGLMETPPEPLYFHEPVAETNAVMAPEEALWHNLGTTNADPGDQVPMAPGAFLDSVNEQLYPADPFSEMDNHSLVEGEQAFAEAAQILFPETMSAPVEWEEPGAVDLSGFEHPPLAMGPDTPSLELGPSHQMSPEGLSDMSSTYIPEPDPVAFASPELATPAFGPLPEPSPNPDFTPGDTWFPEGLGELAEPPSTPPAPEADFGLALTPPDLEYPSPTQALSDQPLGAQVEDQDFYASSFELSEQGEILPTPESISLAPSPAWEDGTSTTPDDNLWPPSPPTPTAHEVSLAPVADEDFNVPGTYEMGTAPDEPSTPLYALDDVSPAPISPPSPAPTDMPPPADHAPSDLESAWHTIEPIAAAPAPTPQPTTPSSQLSMEHLEVLGVCPLDGENRLLLVQNQSIYALMGQIGLDEDPQVNVIKVFDHNPIAYQNTFTAAREGQAGAQGMFVVQVGTWHAIISTSQNTIALHTELG